MMGQPESALLQFLPVSLQERVCSLLARLNLLTARQLQNLFPESRVHSVGAPLIDNSIVASFKRRE